MLRLLGAALLASSVVLAGGAQAEPYAGQYRYLDTGALAIRGADGARWVLHLVATTDGDAQSRGEQRLYVDLDRCAPACRKVGRWWKALADPEISADRPVYYRPVSTGDEEVPRATLRTTIGGRALSVTLESTDPAGAGGSFDGLDRHDSPPGVGPTWTFHHAARGQLRLAGLACGARLGAAEIGEAEEVDTVGREARDVRSTLPARLPAGFLTGPRAAGC